MSVKIIQEPIYNQIKNTNSGFQNKHITGISDVISAGLEVVGLNNQTQYIEFNGVVAVDVVSNNSGDSSGGTGAKTIQVSGLYSDGGDGHKYKPRVATFTLDGTTNASLASGINSFSVINEVRVISHGTSNSNIGAISVKKTGTTSLMGFIQPTHGASNTFSFAVPNRNTLLVKDIHITAFCQTGCVLRLYRQQLISGHRTLESQIIVNDQTSHINHQINLKINENEIFYCFLLPLETITGTNMLTMNCSSLLV
tara:strand:- start:173 stop:934 length:762 start_codon:yes stop_codon:yes gene_type:complete